MYHKLWSICMTILGFCISSERGLGKSMIQVLQATQYQECNQSRDQHHALLEVDAMSC